MPDLTPADVRRDFPEAGDTSVYPDASVQFYLDLGYQLFQSPTWNPAPPPGKPNARPIQQVGIELFVLHNLTLEARAQRQAAAGGIPGTVTGTLSSSAVAGASVSYDVSAVVLQGGSALASFLNQSTYGVRLYYLIRNRGAGGVQF